MYGYNFYLVDSEEEPSFADYVLRAARGFGFAIEQRDEVPGPLVRPSFDSYHVKGLKEAKAALETAKGLTRKAADKLAAKEYEQRRRSNAKARATQARNADRLRRKLTAAHDWSVPEELAEMRQSVIGWLQEDFDRESKAKSYYSAPDWLSPEAYIAAKIEEAEKDVAYHTRELADAEKRHIERNLYIDMLANSLGVEI